MPRQLKRKLCTVTPEVEAFFNSMGKSARYPQGNFSRGLRIAAQRLFKTEVIYGRPRKNSSTDEKKGYILAIAPQKNKIV